MTIKHVPWSKQASIYEVNVRQFTEAGTFNAMAAHLPRLKRLGVDILWFMPIHPIGKQGRKGTLGSYYAVRDYTAVNPEFGTIDDFKRLVQRAHAMGFKVLLDWVANHTAWDHAWVSDHPEWYLKNPEGAIHSYTYQPESGAPAEYWTDVVGLDYTRRGAKQTLWPAMIEALEFWVRECDIDGYRCDVAGFLPTPFWVQARRALDAIKPVFMLAESDAADLHANAFDMTYDWRLYETMKSIAQGKVGASALHAWWAHELSTYGRDDLRMRYTSNHDINSWHGDDVTMYGEAFQAMAVLAATLPGMPLVYAGQESVLDRKIEFFERDPIEWGTQGPAEVTRMEGFYANLMQLKATQPALANGKLGHRIEWFDAGERAVAFVRGQGKERVGVLVNLSNKRQAVMGEVLAPWASVIISPAR